MPSLNITRFETLFLLLILLAFGLFNPRPVLACDFEIQSYPTLLQNTDIAFIGKFDFAEGYKNTGSMGNATVLLPIKGIGREGLSFTVTSSASSCGDKFETGETWLIMGKREHVGVSTSQPSGSLLLTQKDGKPICENWRGVVEWEVKAKAVMPGECVAVAR